MDEMNVRTPFMKAIVSKMFQKAFRNSTGCDIKVNLDSFSVTGIGDEYALHVCGDIKIKKEDLEKLINKSSLI